MKTSLLCCVLFVFSSCNATPAVISSGIAGGLLAINEMLADGTITLDQHSKLTEAFNASKDALTAVTTTVDLIKKEQEGALSPEEAAGGGATIAAALAGLIALLNRKKKPNSTTSN